MIINLSLAQKITTFIVLLLLVSLFLFGFFSFKGINKVQVDQELTNLSRINEGLALAIESRIKVLTDDTVFISLTPPIKGIIRAEKNNGVDPLDKSTLKVWKNRLGIILKEFLKAKPEYLSVSYVKRIDSKNKEYVKAERIGQKIFKIKEKDLGDILLKDKFQKNQVLSPGKVLLSEIYLERKNGIIVNPRVLKLMAISPIFIGYEVSFGFIYIELNPDFLFRHLIKEVQSSLDLSITNSSGHYLFHNKKNKAFSFKWDGKNKAQNDFPELNQAYNVGSIKFDKMDIRGKSIAIFQKIFFDPTSKNKFIGLIIEGSRNEILGKLDKIWSKGILFSGIFIFMIGLLAHFIISYFIKPIELINRAAEDYTNGITHIKLPEKSSDEIGVLSKTFNKMIYEVSTRNSEIKENQHRLKAILDNAVDGIISINNKGIVQMFNKGAEKIFKYTSKEVIGKNVKMLMPSPYKEEHDSYLSNFINTGIKKIIGSGREVVGLRKDGTTFPMDLSVGVIESEGIQYFTGIVRDISERKKHVAEINASKEKAESANKAKTDFLANMSHELRTPLNGIIGFTDILKTQGLNSQQTETIDIIKSCGEALLGLINEVLDFSKIEAGKLEIENFPFNLGEVVETISFMLTNKLSQKGLDLVIQIGKEVPEAINSDIVRFRQILINLISNAIKFTNSGIIKIQINSTKLRDNQCDLQFSVSDTGIGIPEDKIKNLFLPFTQADGSTTRKYGGTGLGLSITKELVELLGGKIRVENNYDNGATFYFNIIVEPVELSQVQETEIESRSGSLDLGVTCPLKILVAEDNSFNQKLIIQLLRGLKYDPFLVENGEEALIEIQKNDYDVILMDLQMPVMDGLEATEKILALSGGQKLPQIIGVTANVSKEDRQLCMDLGMSDFIPKPIKMAVLIKALKNTFIRLS